MALTNNVSNALKGLDDFEQVELGPDEDKEKLKQIDLTKGGGKRRRPKASKALNPSGPQASNEITPGQRVEGTTPEGSAEVSEIEETGKDLSKVGQALANPAVQKFLGQMGIAFSKGNPNEPGTILGKSAIEQAKGQQVNQLAAKMLRGEELTEQDLAGVDAETLGQARESSLRQREQGRKEEATEADIEQGEERLDLEQQRVDIEDRYADLRERGIELDEEKFEFDKEVTREQLAQAETELQIAERKADIRDRLATSLVKLREAEIEQMGKEDEPTPQEQARLNEARNETMQLLSEQIQIERDRLNQMEAEVSSDDPNFGDFVSAFFSGSDQRQAQLQRELENNVPQARQAVERQREFVNDLEEQLRGLQEDTGGETDTPESGGKPVVVESEEDLEGLQPGTKVQNPNGVIGIVQEDGTVDF